MMFDSPIANKRRAIRLESKQAHDRFKESIKVSNSVWATRLPYDSNDTSNYNRFAVDTRSQVKLVATDDDIIFDVLNNSKKIHRKADIRRLDPSCVGNEVKQYWQEKVKQSELRRGRLYIKANE